MHNIETIRLEKIVLHLVGNKQNEESLRFSHDMLSLGDELKDMLLGYFLKPFHNAVHYQFTHPADLSFNVVYNFVSEIFDNQEFLYDKSLALAEHLYEQSTHPKIKGGEFYVVYFSGCEYEGEEVDAIGIFKAENKDTFLKVYQSGDNFLLQSEAGININKLDKGCIIYNTEREEGFVVEVVDNTNRSFEAQYWVEDFLQIRQRRNEYYNTQNTLSLCKDFVINHLPEEFEISKSDQVAMLERSVNFFKENDNFDMQEFKQEVMLQPDIIESFDEFKESYQEENEIQIADSFSISEPAVKKQSKNFRSVIKLDSNFHIYVHGNPQLMKRGVDPETGMNYYQIFFEEEYLK